MTAAAISIPGVLLPILGLTANVTMNGIADLSTDFFHAGHLEHAVHYLSLENLKGAVISVVIGAALYLLFIRPCLMEKGRYVNRWPEKLDLENLVYRPLLLKWLPGICGWCAALFGENRLLAPLSAAVLRISGIAARALCDLPDALVLLFGWTVFAPTQESDDDKVTSSLSYRLGLDLDTLAVRWGRERKGERRYAHLFYRSVQTIHETTGRITGNLSFALLMLVAAICAVFLYMIVLHG